MELVETHSEEPEEAVLVGVDLGYYDAEDSLDELQRRYSTKGVLYG